MSFFLHKGRAHTEWYPKTASTAFSANALVYSTSGQLLPATVTSGDHIGVIQETVASTDSDYASTTFEPLLVAHSNNEWRADVGTGTLTAAMVNTYRDLATSLTLDVSAQAKNVVLITQFLSASLAVIKVNAMAYNLRVATT